MPAGVTYEPLATTTVSGSAAAITFSGISSAYTDLRLVVYAVVNGASTADLLIRFNGDTATNYSYNEMVGNGSSTSGTRAGNQSSIQITESAWGTTTGALAIMDIFSYAGSTNKTVLTVGNRNSAGSPTGRVVRGAGLWRSSSTISSINIRTSFDGLMGVGSIATLYGIARA